MKSKKSVVKDVVKPTSISPKSSFTDPNDPWSAKANVAENITSRRSNLLKQFYKSKGWNVNYISKNKKVAQSKTGEYEKWKRDHGFYEENQLDEISNDLLTRYKSKAGEQASAADKTGDFKKANKRFAGIVKATKKQFANDDKQQRVAEGFNSTTCPKHGSYEFYGRHVPPCPKCGYPEAKTRDEYYKSMNAEKYGKKDDQDLAEAEKNPFNNALGKALYRDLSKEKKASPQQVQRNKERWTQRQKEREQGVAEEKSTWKGHSDTVKNPNFNDELSNRRVNPVGNRLKSGKLSADERGSQERVKTLMKYTQKKGGLTGPKGPLPEEQGVAEDSVDPKAATQSPADGANGGEEVAPRKSIKKIVKEIYNSSRQIKEDLYDWEKDDKAAKPYGKKPSVQKLDGVNNIGDDKPNAGLILKGGKTLTGEPRDTVEIDPMLKNRSKMPDYKSMDKIKQKPQ